MPKYPEIGERNMCNNEEKRERSPEKNTASSGDKRKDEKGIFHNIYAFHLSIGFLTETTNEELSSLSSLSAILIRFVH